MLPSQLHNPIFHSILPRDEAAPQKILDSAAEKPSGWLDDEPDMVSGVFLHVKFFV